MLLEALQDDFAKSLLDPDLEVPRAVVSAPNGYPEKRFAIYRNNVMSSLVDALGEAFPVIKRLVGDEFFKAMAAQYVRSSPPANPLLMEYGDSFADFFRGFEPASSLPYLPEIALLEQARRDVYHEADATPLSDDFLGTVPENELGGVIFTFKPAHRLAVFDFPSFSIWQMSRLEQEGQELPSHGEEVLIYRRGEDVRIRQLSSGGVLFLENLRAGKTLGESAEQAAQIDGFDLADSLSAIIEARLVTGLTSALRE